jgi:hypothetical protein
VARRGSRGNPAGSTGCRRVNDSDQRAAFAVAIVGTMLLVDRRRAPAPAKGSGDGVGARLAGEEGFRGQGRTCRFRWGLSRLCAGTPLASTGAVV